MDYNKTNTNNKATTNLNSDYAPRKPQYRCAICNTPYDEIEDRMKCEQKCLKKQEEERKKRKQEAMKAKKDERYKEVIDAINKAENLYEKYLDDYGAFTYTNETFPKSHFPHVLDKYLGWF